MQKLTFIFLCWCCTLSLYGQSYRTLIYVEGEVPVIDVVRYPENTFDVARFPDSYLNFPCAVQLGSSQEILTAYIKTDSVRSIEMTRSRDGGRTWSDERFSSNWSGETFRSLSMYDLGQPSIAPRRGKNHGAGNNLILFSGGNPILISSSYTAGEQWCNFYPANNFGGFRISSLVRLRDGRHMALFHDDGRFLYHDEESHTAYLRKSVIYKIYSSDGGLTWSEPQIALKHNLHGLYDAVAVYSPGRKSHEMIMIVSERETGAAYIAVSSDHGNNWSYPVRVPFIQGDRFGIATYHRQVILTYRDMSRTLNDGTHNPTFGDLVMWTGEVQELLNRNPRSGIKIRIADNYPTTDPVDYNDRKFFDCGYVSVIPLSRHEVSVIAYGRWEKEELPFVRNFVINTVELRQHLKSLR